MTRAKIFRLAIALFSLFFVTACRRHVDTTVNPKVVRCAVIGGMTMTGLWPEIAKKFEAETGYKVEVTATGPRPVLDKVMRAGKVDLLTMHSGDITTDLVADGFGIHAKRVHGAIDCALIHGPVDQVARSLKVSLPGAEPLLRAQAHTPSSGEAPPVAAPLLQ